MMSQNWKSRVRKKKSKGKSEKAGDNKPTCKTNPLKRFFFSNPKARNHRDYPRWHNLAKKMNKVDK